MGKFNTSKQFITQIFKPKSKISKTITSTKPNVGNLKFNQDTRNKLITMTDRYVAGPGQVHAGLKKSFRDAGSKSLQGDKILRKGGRKNLKFGGGADMGSKKLSPKQMKIAKLAGDPKKIDAPDFKKLRGKKA